MNHIIARLTPRRGAIALTAFALTAVPIFANAGPAVAAPAKSSVSSVNPDDGTPINCTFTSSRPTIRRGSTGNAVRQAQCYLNDSLNPAFHTPLAIDGDFGPRTDAAVHTFQSCAGIAVDGVIGPQTWAALQFWADNSSYVC